MKKLNKYFTLLFLAAATLSAHAKVSLPAIFSDNMVLQQNTSVAIRGKAKPGEKVDISVSWSNKTYSVVTPGNGKWALKLNTPTAGGKHSLTVKGENTITINNILIGEVWLCTGQSNMEFPTGKDPKSHWKIGMFDEKEEMKDATYADIRLFKVENQLSPASPFRTDVFAPDTYARRFADSEMRRFPEAWQLDHGKRLFFGYPQGLGCCAMLKMWKHTGEKRYFDYVEQWADSLINEKGDIHLYQVETYNIDYINPGKVLFDLYRETGKEKYKLAMDLLVKQMKNHPRTLEGGYWHKLIYQHQIWLDGLYMASPFLAQYGAEFNHPEWIDEAVKQFTLCHKHTYDAETGLYHHAWDESKSQRWANPETGHSPNFWGRSIGWWYMALVDVLDFMPENHAGRASIISMIQGLADSLPKYQDKDGLWYQVLDQPTGEGNFPEASVTAQFMYAYAKAVNKGYIDKKYRVYAEKAFNGLKDKLITENSDGTLTLTRCCQVGGLGGNPYRDGSFEYYIGEKMRDNDTKATGPYIMGCLELAASPPSPRQPHPNPSPKERGSMRHLSRAECFFIVETIYPPLLWRGDGGEAAGVRPSSSGI